MPHFTQADDNTSYFSLFVNDSLHHRLNTVIVSGYSIFSFLTSRSILFYISQKIKKDRINLIMRSFAVVF